MRILIVGDNIGVYESMERALEMYGHSVDWGRNLEGARFHLSERAYDLVILDYELPDGIGPDLIPEIGDADAVLNSGLPRDDYGIPAFSKGDPFALFDYIELLAKALESDQ